MPVKKELHQTFGEISDLYIEQFALAEFELEEAIDSCNSEELPGSLKKVFLNMKYAIDAVDALKMYTEDRVFQAEKQFKLDQVYERFYKTLDNKLSSYNKNCHCNPEVKRLIEILKEQ